MISYFMYSQVLHFSFRSKVDILNLQKSLCPMHLQDKRETFIYDSLAIWHYVGRITVLQLKSFFFYAHFFTTRFGVHAWLRKCQILQNFARNSNVERKEFILFEFKYPVVKSFGLNPSYCNSNFKLVALKVVLLEILFSPVTHCFLLRSCANTVTCDVINFLRGPFSRNE